MFYYDLQLFAKDGPGGEKTEPATQKKLDDARKEGQVAKSREIALGLSLLAMFFTLRICVGWLGEMFMENFSGAYSRIPEFIKMPDSAVYELGILNLIRYMLLRMLLILAPFLLIGFFVAFIADLVQVKWRPTFKPMQPKLSKFSPLKGLKKIVSAQSFVELGKAIVKILLISYLVYTTLRDQVGMIFALYDMTLINAVAFMGNTIIGLGIRISLFYLIISAVDYLYQKWKFSEDMKMTKQEVKDEMKNAEGDPQIKGKIRQKMREASRRRMMQSVPEADVVITNPTHLAVAILYDAERYQAPIVLAKGEDFLAQKIKEVARQNKIQIVEDKPLARMLYANVEVGELVPPELYQAVAEVLAFVYNAEGRI